MNREKKIIIIILILIILLFLSFILIKNNDNLVNETVDNRSIKDNISKNMTLNTVNNSNNTTGNSMESWNNHEPYQLSQDNSHYDKKSKVKSDKIIEEIIRERVKRGVVWEDSNGKDTQDVRIGKIFKVSKILWLVPAFDKKTGKFLGAVYTTTKGGYYGGIDSYSLYKKIISGKKISSKDINVDTNDYSNVSQKEEKSPILFVLAKSNPNYSDSSQSGGINVFDKDKPTISTYSYSLKTDNQNDVNLDKSNILDCNSEEVIVDSGGDVNSTG